MTIEERLAALAEHGIGCPRAVTLGGPAAVEAWIEQQETDIEAREAAEADAAAVAEVSADADAMAEGKAAVVEGIYERLDALEGRVAEIEAVIADSPTEDAIGDVAAGGNGPPTIHGPHDPEPEAPKDPEPDKDKGKGKGKGSKPKGEKK